MSALPDPLAVVPFTGPVRGSVRVPGSKSITNRALILAALCAEPVTLKGALFSDDTRLMAEALRKLGFSVIEDAATETLVVDSKGRGLNLESAELFVGLAGTAARFLTALCAAAPSGVFTIDGVPQMRHRPMRGLISALRSLGADIVCTGEEGFFPLEIHARGLRGGKVSIDASESSQMLSALLMVAPLANGPVAVSVRGGIRLPFVQLTVRQMAQFGLTAQPQEAAGAFTVANGSYTSPGTYLIEPDATAASYFAALPLVAGGSITLKGLQPAPTSLQGDIRFLEILKRSGATVTEDPSGLTVSFDKANSPAPIREDFSGFSDTFLTLAAIAPLLSGTTKITGIGHTRKQETDRVAGMAGELRRLGQGIIEEEEAITISPRRMNPGMLVETYRDHRFAMSFAILGCFDLAGDGTPWLRIKDPSCCAKTFPSFFTLLETVRENSP